MRKRIVLEKIPTTKPNTFLRVEVYYEIGGLNYFSGGTRKRGYWLSVTPIEEQGDFTCTTAFSGTCDLLEETKRFSAKRLQEVVNQLSGKSIYQQLISHVKSKNGIVLASEVTEPIQQEISPAPVETAIPS